MLGHFFLILAIGTAWRLRPWVDEGWYGAPALTLVTKGYMGTPCFIGNLWNLPHLEQRSYWIMPIYPLAVAAWFSVFPATLHSMRVVSIIAGLAGILSWAYFFAASQPTISPPSCSCFSRVVTT